MADRELSNEARRRKYAVPALEKGLDILEYLSEQAVTVTQAELSRALSRQPSEIFRIITCLETRGYLRRDPNTGGYALTLRLFELSRTHSPHESLLSAARPQMRILADEVRESCHFSVLHNGRVLVLAQEESPRSMRLSVEVGASQSPMRTTSGRLLLAALDVEERLDVLRPLPEWRAADKKTRDAFLRRLNEIAARGHETIVGETFIGGADIGVLVGSPGRLNAALTIATLIPADGENPCESFLPALHRCAAVIADRAGLTSIGVG